jgi:hypothetical protein
MPPCPAYWLGWGLANFLPRLVLNLYPPGFCLTSSWDYRLEPLSLACELIFYIELFSVKLFVSG